MRLTKNSSEAHALQQREEIMRILPILAAVALAAASVPTITTQVLAQSMAKSAIIAADHSMRGSKLIGMDIFNQQGMKIGRIEDILVKGSAAEPVAILSVGAFAGGGDKMVAVPMSHISLNADKASMPATKAEIAAMPGWQFNGLSGGGG
jgi:sporulation protein YlmC with PRC-barrel domain